MTVGPALIEGFSEPPENYDIDIIILTTGRPEETYAAVISATHQSGIKFHISLLIQGGALADWRPWLEGLRGFETMSCYFTDQNLGVGGGRNFLSACGHGRFIAALDNDAVFAHDRVLAEAMGVFEQSPQLAAIGFKILNSAGNDLDHYSWGYPRALKSRHDQQFLVTTFVGAGYALRRDAWCALGGYDERLFFTWEEYDFCLRAIAAGWSILYHGELGVLHKLSSEKRVSWRGERLALAVRNRLVIARKWREPLPRLALRVCGYIGRGAVNGEIAATLRGIYAAHTFKLAAAPQTMPAPMRRYLRENEQKHRGGLFTRLRHEVLYKLPSETGQRSP